MIKISVPNDDSAALFHLGKSLIDLSSTVEGSPGWVVITQQEYNSLQARDSVEIGPVTRLQQATFDLMQAAPTMMRENDVDGLIEIHGKRKEVEPDTTSQQYESLQEELRKKHIETVTTPFVDNFDSNGTPWDERIHSASKALNSDGTWRLRRKPKDMDEGEWCDYVDMIKADLQHPVECGGQEPADREQEVLDAIRKATDDLSKGVPVAEAVAPLAQSEPSVTPAGDDFHVDAGEVTEQEVAAIPAPPLPPVPQVEEKTAPDGHEYAHMTFPQVMQFLTERHGRITSAQVDDIIADMGLNSIMDLNTQPEHTGRFIARVKALLGE